MKYEDRKYVFKTIFGAVRKLPHRAIVGKCNNKMHEGYVTDRELKKHKCLSCNEGGKCPYLTYNYTYKPLKGSD